MAPATFHRCSLIDTSSLIANSRRRFQELNGLRREKIQEQIAHNKMAAPMAIQTGPLSGLKTFHMGSGAEGRGNRIEMASSNKGYVKSMTDVRELRTVKGPPPKVKSWARREEVDDKKERGVEILNRVRKCYVICTQVVKSTLCEQKMQCLNTAPIF